MKDVRTLKRQSIYLIIMSFLVLGVLTSYALGAFEAVLPGNQVSSVSTCSLDINFVDTNPVTLLAGIPIDDVDASNYDPYVVTIRNNNSNCKDINYVLTMNSLCANCEKTDGKCAVGDSTCNCNDGYQIDSSLIKYSVKNVESGVVTTGSDPYKNLKLRGTIANVGDSANYEIKMWISKDAINSDIYVSNGSGGYLEDSNGNYLTKDFCSKIKLDVDTEKTLATAIMEQGVVTSGDGLYVSTATNDARPTYYYRGNVTNNCVSFANQTWRIVRINEDGTIRLLMQSGIADNTTYSFMPNVDTQYGEYRYMYYTNTNVEGGAMRLLNDWYNVNLSSYDHLVVNSLFCEEAKITSDLATEFVIGDAVLKINSEYEHNYRCEMDGNGHGPITNQKIGLLTYDEVMFAGGDSMSSFHVIHPNKLYDHTMSPAGVIYNVSSSWIFGRWSPHEIVGGWVTDTATLRPVINLVSSVTLEEVPFVACPANS